MKKKKTLAEISEEINRDIWKRFLKFYKGNIERTITFLVKEEDRMLKNSKRASKRRVKFFKKIAKEEYKK